MVPAAAAAVAPPATTLQSADALIVPALAMEAPADRAIPPAPPAAMPDSLLSAPTSMPLLPLLTGDDFVTVQWVETHIGPVTTWVPVTVTFHFEPMSQAPLPGVGSIGMGTLTGKTGQTQTVWTVVAAAPTASVDAKQVVAVAVAVGAVGLVM